MWLRRRGRPLPAIMERDEGGGREEGGIGVGGRESAQDVGGRLGLRQRSDEAPGHESIGEARGHVEQRLVPPTRNSDRSGDPSLAKLSNNRRASKVAGWTMAWASSTTRRGRRP